ncbi:hypothetical protein JW752_04900 [Candidatus Peregrinibacteria bacterium]|nr:hypothetical protein [Candidatus Peregrinibacteria bacterium]
MPDLSIKQGRSHDASVIIENLEGKTIEEVRTDLTKREAGQVKDVRDLVDQLLAPGHEDDRQKYGAIKQAADIVYGEKLEGKKSQLLPDEAIEQALKPLELAEEGAVAEGVEVGQLRQQRAVKARPRVERMAEEAAKAAPPAKEVLKLEGKHEKLSSGLVAAWLEQYGKEKVKKGLLHMFGRENQNFADEKLDRFLYALEKNPDNLPSPELDEIRLALKAEVSSEVVADILKDRIMRGASPLPDDQEAKAA